MPKASQTKKKAADKDVTFFEQGKPHSHLPFALSLSLPPLSLSVDSPLMDHTCLMYRVRPITFRFWGLESGPDIDSEAEGQCLSPT